MMEAIILAGGKGTRLRPLTVTVPKPMVPIAEKPFLHYLFTYLKQEGVSRIILSIGYLGEQIIKYFSDNWQGIELVYVTEKEPLGTGGAIAVCMDKVSDDNVIVINGDTFCQLDLKQMMQSHQQQQADISVALKEMFNFDRYGAVDIDDEQHIIKFNEKRKITRGLINTGTYCLKKDIFTQNNMPEKFSFETDFMQNKINELKSNAFITDGYFIDIGIPEDYQRAQTELVNISGTMNE